MIRLARGCADCLLLAAGLAGALTVLLAAEAILRSVGLERFIECLRQRSAAHFLRRQLKRVGFTGIVARWIDRVDRHLPLVEPSCLRCALASRILSGEELPLRIGVRRAPGGTIEAHAWTGPGNATDRDYLEIAAL